MNVPYSGMQKAFRPIWKVETVLSDTNCLIEEKLNSLVSQDYEIVNIQYIRISEYTSHSYGFEYQSGAYPLQSSCNTSSYEVQIIARKWESKDT